MIKISLAMTTYNGERYIIRQLDSLKNQTRELDEVIICDDRSTDNTATLVTEYIKCNKLDNWTFTINERNVGFAENFKKAIAMTSGDLIFLCDQDDEWHDDKIEKMANIICSDENVSALVSSLEFIDQDSNKKMPEYIPNWYKKMNIGTQDEIRKIDFLSICTTNFAPGCTMCFTREIAREYLEFKFAYSIAHDWLVSLISSAHGGFYYINSPMIDYRIHSNNAIGVKSAAKSKNTEQQLQSMERLKSRYEIGIACNYKSAKQIMNNIDYINARIIFYNTRKMRALLQVWKKSTTVYGIYKKQQLVNFKDLMYLLHLIFYLRGKK